MPRYAVMSDLHGNLFALEAVYADLQQFDIDGILLLGDLIDYGMQSNETVAFLREKILTRYPVICNIWGNHERATLEHIYEGFSAQRGKDCAAYTAGILTEETKEYLRSELVSEGCLEFMLDGKKALAVHGSLSDVYWKAIFPQELRGDYREYDLVFSGHSHQPHCFSVYYEGGEERLRGKKKVTFINPGSVGQPRNQNPNAQYMIFDPTDGSVIKRSVLYDVEAAMSLYHGQVDDFYRSRLELGV